ncbi:MAG TPA: flagellar biosynthetic protein FliR [Candidatus Saccharimonadales bacterium]|nr:flagellar biosynthetic protein FliR [Candidatus Saccharimonadales bacterium]
MDSALILGAPTFVLAFARVAGILGSGPFFSGRSVPTSLKIGLAFFVTLLVLPLLHPGTVQLPPTLLATCLAVLREVAIGAAVGLLAQLVFAAVQMAGELLGLQMGFSLMNLVDPTTGVTVPVISEVYGFFAALLFFVLDAHHLFLRGIFASFELAPLGTGSFHPATGVALAAAVGQVFEMALELAGPVLAALFLTDVALGLVARTIPQMNVFTVGFPLKIALGLMALAMTLPLLAGVLEHQFSVLETSVRQLLHGM